MISNKFLIVILIFIFLINNITSNKEHFRVNNHFKIVVTFYNPGYDYLKKCLESIDKQNYKNYEVCLVNDCSNKDTKILDDLCNIYSEKGWKYEKKNENKGPCSSRIDGINILKPNDDDIIILIDGDDKLNNNMVLDILNNKYQDNTLITFGNFIKIKNNKQNSNKMINCEKINLKELSANRKFRNLPNNKYPFSHLKTFKFKLYKNLDLNDLKKNGDYIKSSTDAALMYPLLEMAGENIKCIKEILYDYTIDHNESFHNSKKKKNKQLANLRYVQGLKKYDILDENKLQKFNVYYINLEKRKDRKEFIEKQLKKLNKVKNINFNTERFNAIKSDIHGGIGCGKSHIGILKKAKEKKLPFVMIIEDDIEIKNENLNIYFEILQNTTYWDVFILSGHGESENYNNLIDKAIQIQTTGWYIVKQHYYDKLINVFTESVNNMEQLSRKGSDIDYETWAIDQNWKKLQPGDNWLKFKDNLGFQIEDYSDIVKEEVNYTDILH